MPNSTVISVSQQKIEKLEKEIKKLEEILSEEKGVTTCRKRHTSSCRI